MRKNKNLNKEIALAINGILDDFKSLSIIDMEILSIFHLWNASNLYIVGSSVWFSSYHAP